jgi:hypothetical protein
VPATATSGPTPAPPKPADLDVNAVLSSVAHGVWAAVSSSPWLMVVLAILVLSGGARFVRGIVHAGHPRDVVRRFSQSELRIIFSRAGNRCEHHVPVFGRCRATDGLEADHIHPHSRGGWTSVSNGQALCQRHNREKSARVPWNWELQRLTRRRATYFLGGHDPAVVRHRPRTASVPVTQAIAETEFRVHRSG